MQFEEELTRFLPLDLPRREQLIAKAAQHLRLVAEANETMNLTRISSPAEAAIKHVFDSVAPWPHFQGARHILDAGTGAGFPGIPLSIVLPDVRFTLAESVQKKARFVDSAVDKLDLANVDVVPERAELRTGRKNPDIITARAVAPLARLVELFREALRNGSRLLLYKGPDVEAEFSDLKRDRVVAEVVCRYDLPEGLGGRTLVSVRKR